MSLFGAELRSVAFPRILSLLERSGGPLIGGAYPCIGDLVVGLSLMAAQLKMPTLDIWTASIVQYTRCCKAKLRGWASYMADKEVLFGGYRLQAQYPSGPQALEFSKDATLGQLLDALTEGSKLPVGDMAIKCGGGILGCEPVVLAGAEDSELFEHTWSEEGPVGLQLTGGVFVEDTAPFVPANIKGMLLQSIAGERVLDLGEIEEREVSASSHDDIVAKLEAAARPLTLSFKPHFAQGYNRETTLVELGVHHSDVVLVKSIAATAAAAEDTTDESNTARTAAPALLARTISGGHAVCPVCSRVFEVHNIQVHIEMHLDGSEDGAAGEGGGSPAPGKLRRTYTQTINEEVALITKIDMDQAGHVFFPFNDDEPRGTDQALS